MRKKCMATLLALSLILCSNTVVQAQDGSNFKSSLPVEFSYDVKISEIEKDILAYIDWLELDIEYGTS